MGQTKKKSVYTWYYATDDQGIGKQVVTGKTGTVTQATAGTDDYMAYGSLYQWCRAADGHQLMVWSSSSAGSPVTTEVITGPVSSSAPGHSKFISATASPYDWLSPQKWDGAFGGMDLLPEPIILVL